MYAKLNSYSNSLPYTDDSPTWHPGFVINSLNFYFLKGFGLISIIYEKHYCFYCADSILKHINFYERTLINVTASSYSSGIYKTHCDNNCVKEYIGQSKRKLKFEL